MPAHFKQFLCKAGAFCRTCAACVIAGLWPRRSLSEVETRLAACSARQQVVITSGIFFLLISLGFFAAQFGWIGILIYWMTIILIIR